MNIAQRYKNNLFNLIEWSYIDISNDCSNYSLHSCSTHCSRMAGLRCSIPNCQFLTPPESHDPLCNLVLLLAHTNFHLVSLLLSQPPPPPRPSVFPVNLPPLPFSFHSRPRYPVPSAPMIPRARVSTSSVRPRRMLSPRHNQSLRAYRLQVPRNSEMELATQIRNATIPPASPSSTDEIDVGTEPNLVISNVVSLAGRAGSPFVFNTPE